MALAIARPELDGGDSSFARKSSKFISRFSHCGAPSGMKPKALASETQVWISSHSFQRARVSSRERGLMISLKVSKVFLVLRTRRGEIAEAQTEWPRELSVWHLVVGRRRGLSPFVISVTIRLLKARYRRGASPRASSISSRVEVFPVPA